MDDLNEQFAAHVKRILREDPELAEEVTQSRAELRDWVQELVQQQTEGDDIASCVKRFVKAHLSATGVMRFLP